MGRPRGGDGTPSVGRSAHKALSLLALALWLAPSVACLRWTGPDESHMGPIRPPPTCTRAAESPGPPASSPSRTHRARACTNRCTGTAAHSLLPSLSAFSLFCSPSLPVLILRSFQSRVGLFFAPLVCCSSCLSVGARMTTVAHPPPCRTACGHVAALLKVARDVVMSRLFTLACAAGDGWAPCRFRDGDCCLGVQAGGCLHQPVRVIVDTRGGQAAGRVHLADSRRLTYPRGRVTGTLR